jgi:hypothetical protein
MSEFDWNDADIVIHHQPRTAIYRNPRGQVVIRQENDDPFDEDAYVFFSLENVPALIRGLKEELDLEDFDPAAHDPKVLLQLGIDPSTGRELKRDGTGASRQRRYRARKRNGVTVERDAHVTDAFANDGEPLLQLAGAAE